MLRIKQSISLLSVFLFFLFAFTAPNLKGGDGQKAKTEKYIADAKKIITDNPDSALLLLNEAEKIATKENDKTNLTEVYRRMGVAYHYAGDYENAQVYNFKALKLREENDGPENDSLNKAEIANIIYNIAINYQYLEEYALAIQYASKLEDIYKELEDPDNLGFRCYSLIANIYYYLGDYLKAQEYGYKELAVYEKMNDPIGLSYSKDFLAMLKQDQYMNKEALDLQFESLEIRKLLNDPLLLSFSYNNIGSTYFRLEDYKNALMYFNMSLDIKEKYGDNQNIPSTLNNMGLVYQDMGEFDKSIECHKDSYNICKDLNNNHGIATAAINLGIAYDLSKNQVLAEKYLLEAYDIALRNGYKNLIIDATDFLAGFYERHNRYKEAFDMLVLNEKYLDSVKNDDIIKQFTKMEVEYEFNKKHAEDSIARHHEMIVNQAVHKEELKRKEQLVWILAAIFLFIIFIIFVLFKSYQYKRISAEKDLKQKALEIEKNLLRSQMNPHFIFNAMNSIQSFIAVNDTYSAERYLSKFAKLIRMILENSTLQTIPLCEEVLSLNLYLDLEKVRFNNKFDFTINVANDIEDELIAIPPMLIQPFVENAILHGMMHKETRGEIAINIKEDEENQILICEISDNGIGREASAKIKERYKAEGKKHKSIGMQLTRERLEALNTETQTGVSCEIIDLYDNQHNAAGTKVIVRIPYFDIQNQ